MLIRVLVLAEFIRDNIKNNVGNMYIYGYLAQISSCVNTAETRKYPTTKSHNVGQVEDYYISTKLYSFSSYSSDVLMMWLSLYMLFNTVIPTFAHSIAEIFNTLQHIRWKFSATG